MHLMMSSLTL